MSNIEYKPKCEVISMLIHLLYELDGCSCGGLCHIVTDDNNIHDDDLEFVIDYCKQDENKDCIDKEISSLICSLMLELTFEQRVVLLEVHKFYGYVNEYVWNDWMEVYYSEHILKEYGYYESTENQA